MSETNRIDVVPVPEFPYQNYTIQGPIEITYNKIDVRRHREYYGELIYQLAVKPTETNPLRDTPPAHLLNEAFNKVSETFDQSRESSKIKYSFYCYTHREYLEDNTRIEVTGITITFKLPAEVPSNIFSRHGATALVLRALKPDAPYADKKEPEEPLREYIRGIIRGAIDKHVLETADKQKKAQEAAERDQIQKDAIILADVAEEALEQAAQKRTNYEARLKALQAELTKARDEERAKVVASLKANRTKIIHPKEPVSKIKMNPASVDIAIERLEFK